METQTTHRDICHRRYPRGPDGINHSMCCCSPMVYNLPNRRDCSLVSMGRLTPMAGVLLGSGERADGYGVEGYVRRGIFYLEKSGCVHLLMETWYRDGDPKRTPVQSDTFLAPA
eukprot:scaffold148101_cov62-Attheya_sp.AAC.3